MLPDLTPEEWTAGLDTVAGDLLKQSGVDAPPVDAFVLANRLKIAVAINAGQEGRGRFVRLNPTHSQRSAALIVIRPEDRAERSQWAVAHEIGEAIAHRVFAQWQIDPCETAPQARETVANELAGRLLLPTRWFVRDGHRSDWDLLSLKEIYSTASHELIARRMLQCPAAAIITIIDNGRIHFRGSNVPGQVLPMSRAEKECWRTVSESGKPAECDVRALEEGAGRIFAWPIHETHWKREILRRELELETIDI